MRRETCVAVLATLIWAAAPVCSDVTPARGVRSDSDSVRVIGLSHEPPDRTRLLLGRAAMEQSLGNLRGTVENLEAIDFEAESSFSERDRAAFLLAQAYLRLGSFDRFTNLARTASRWDPKSPFTQWLSYQLLLTEAEFGDSASSGRTGKTGVTDESARRSEAERVDAGVAAAKELAAELLIREGHPEGALRLLSDAQSHGDASPLALHLKAIALERTGADDVAELTALGAGDTSTTLGKDLAGAALIRLAGRARARDESADALLGKVPAGSRFAPRSIHMLGMAALERGDVGRGIGILKDLLVRDSTYADRREVWLTLAGHALEEGHWEEAEQIYQEIDRNWERHRDALEGLLARRSFDDLWSSWESNAEGNDALMLDALPARMLAEHLTTTAANLNSRPDAQWPTLAAPAHACAMAWPIVPPPARAWTVIAAAKRRADEVASELARNRWAMAREVEGLGERRRYMGIGAERVRLETAHLTEWTTLLDSLRSRLEAIDVKLRAMRDEAKRHVALRVAKLLAACDQNVAWMQGMRYLYVEGTDAKRAGWTPQGFPGPDSVLAREEVLARAIRAVAESVAAETPGKITRSYELAWRPGLIDRAAVEDADARRAQAWARALEASVDSALAVSWTNETIRQLDLRALGLEQQRDSLRGVVATLRENAAREAVEHAFAAVYAQREAIDYGLAVSLYGLSVRLTQRDSVRAQVAVSRDASPASERDTLHAAGEPGEDAEDLKSARWRSQAIPMLKAFLERHPLSFARGEMRFRLADLEMIEARRAFREQMAQYVRHQADGAATGLALPVLSHASALALYRQILAEDRDFPHRDAVLFDGGMILADEADPEAAAFFEHLVAEHPQSPYCQEAYLRMGDMEFNQKQFRAGVELYQHAASGADPSLRVIAFYKMGWAHFNEDRFSEAADAFRSVLDLYNSEHRSEIHVDIEGEAESYLVYSLAGAGGAAAFTDFFDRIGPRAYDHHVLMALGQHFRRYGEYPNAAAIDELCIRRYPLDPDALVSSQRLVETYQRSNRPALEREARLTFAPRFAPGGEWFVAQRSDSVRAAGSEFARTSLKSIALEHHRKARENGTPEEWKAAIRLYETLLSTWPRDSEATTFELNVGEASAQLADYPAALRHYGAAARAGRDSIASKAMGQRVAVTDAWYESTRSGPTRGAVALGSDSLAHAVIAAGDELLARYPEHARGADIVWRQSQLGLAHGWFERAARDLERMATRYPDDPRAPVAASRRGDALFQIGQFEAAGAAFEAALVAARRAGRDSLVHRAEQAIPVCYYRQAEAAVAADSTRFEQHAALFEKVAAGWPEYEHADLAEYRAGLAFIKAQQPREAVRAMQTLIQRFPRSEYLKDAHLQVARTWEAIGDREQAAEAYSEFARNYPDDESARGAWLKAADLLAAAGLGQRAENLRLEYIRKYPDDIETAMEILEALARRDLAAVGPERPISTLLGTSGSARAPAKPASHLADYLQRAEKHPTLASRDLLAQLRFLQGEEAYAACAAARLGQPLAKSIPARQKLLDTLLVRYRRSVNLGVPQWAHASVFRIGQALVDFAEALEHCESPADFHGDDLRAYQDVLMEQSRGFSDRGEAVWADLLRHKGPKKPDDNWIAQTQSALWHRLSNRFLFRPEVEYPVVGAKPPDQGRTPKEHAEHSKVSARSDSRVTPTVAQREGK